LRCHIPLLFLFYFEVYSLVVNYLVGCFK
jgi:hypothetical protein